MSSQLLLGLIWGELYYGNQQRGSQRERTYREIMKDIVLTDEELAGCMSGSSSPDEFKARLTPAEAARVERWLKFHPYHHFTRDIDEARKPKPPIPAAQHEENATQLYNRAALSESMKAGGMVIPPHIEPDVLRAMAAKELEAAGLPPRHVLAAPPPPAPAAPPVIFGTFEKLCVAAIVAGLPITCVIATFAGVH